MRLTDVYPDWTILMTGIVEGSRRIAFEPRHANSRLNKTWNLETVLLVRKRSGPAQGFTSAQSC
jgi:hypothetical protein